MAADGIVALSSGGGRAGVAVIRASGRSAAAGLAQLVGGPVPVRSAVLRTIRHPRDGEIVDRGLVLLFRGPASFTGEDSFELHVHGGRAVVAAALDAVLALGGFRLAEPGEFARRAFAAGKLDLTAVEGIADLVAAETEMQRRQAVRLAGGAAARRLDAWRGRLVAIRARIEAGIDFSDEDGVPGELWRAAAVEVGELADEIGRAVANTHGERIRAGAEIVVIGAPNAGKSTLVNAIAGREVAIVSEEAGTTRDLIEVRLDLEGFAATIVDTAGLREGAARVEAEGVRRARSRAGVADIVLLLGAPDVGWPDWPGTGAVRVLNKGDLLDSDSKQRAAGEADFIVSGLTGEGVDALLKGLATRVASSVGSEYGVVTRVRHREALSAARDALLRAVRHEAGQLELAAEELRLAADAIGRVTGRIGVEEVLGAIFAEFCIGK